MAEENNLKLYLGIAFIILVMVSSYLLFPSSYTSNNQKNIDFQRQIESLKNEISDIKPSFPTSTPTTSSMQINGPGGCSTFEECEEYCSFPENEEECREYFLQ